MFVGLVTFMFSLALQMCFICFCVQFWSVFMFAVSCHIHVAWNMSGLIISFKHDKNSFLEFTVHVLYLMDPSTQMLCQS